MLKYVVRNRALLDSAILALVLPFVAGAVNASGFFIVGVYTSHVTGSVARIGDELAQGQLAAAVGAAALVLAFLAGAITATALLERARRMRRARYAGVLLCEAGMLLAVTLLGLARPRDSALLHAVTTALLCFSMGAQNALVTKLSGAVVRTTHLTGIVTDVGIEAVRVVAWLRREMQGAPSWRRLAVLWRACRHPELERLRLHGAIFASFLGGALVGPWLYVHHGHLSMLLPIGVLSGLVVFDAVLGLRSQPPRRVPARTPVLAAPLPDAPARDFA